MQIEKQNPPRLKAVIIKGNPKRILSNQIYDDLKKLLENLGMEVIFDDGEPYTKPPKSDIWIGHSRGVDRLQFAPKDTLTIKLGSSDKDALNHPDEVISSNPDDFDTLSQKQKQAHVTLHPSVANAIEKKIQERFNIF